MISMLFMLYITLPLLLLPLLLPRLLQARPAAVQLLADGPGAVPDDMPAEAPQAVHLFAADGVPESHASSAGQTTAVYTDYKHCSVINAQGGYSEFVQVHIYTLPDGSTEDRVQHYTLKPGERIVDAMPPTNKLHAGTAGFIRPVWDDEAATWTEGASAKESAAWEAEHPAPEPVPEVPSETEQLKAKIAALEAEKAERSELEAMAAAIERGLSV